MVGLLNGALRFVADLARALYRIGAHPEIEFMRLASYGPGNISSGRVHLLRSIAYGAALLRQPVGWVEQNAKPTDSLKAALNRWVSARSTHTMSSCGA